MTPEEASELIDIFEEERPEATRLALHVSLAVRIEPELVRAIRLRLLPDVDAGAEADLWFSPLVQTQSPSLMIFVPAVAESLRSRLAKNQELLSRVWELLREFHRDAPPALRLEEEVTWLALSGNEGRIEERLRSVLAAMKNERRSGLARWAVRALPSLPVKARDTEAARILSLVAGFQTGVGPVLPVLPRAGLTQEWLNQAVAKTLGRALIGVRLLKNNAPGDAASKDGGDGTDSASQRQRAGRLIIELSYPPQPAAEEVEVPDTYRQLLELTWKDSGREQTRRVSLVEGETMSVEVGSSEVTMRTVLGESHILRPRFEYDFFLAYNRSDEAWAERLVQSLEEEPRPAGPLKIISSTLDHDYSELLPHWSEVAFRESRKVGFVLSPASSRKDLSVLEFLSLKRPEPSHERGWLIPILLQPVEMPALLKDLPLVNFNRDWSFFESIFGALWLAVTGERRSAKALRWPRPQNSSPPSAKNDPSLRNQGMPHPPPKLFISYAREDEKYKNELVEHLKGLARRDVIASWHDGQLVAGQQWNDEIVRNLRESRVVLLLISPSFISSDYISRVELAEAGERYERGEVSVIPVLVRNVHAWASKPLGSRTLGSFQAVPRNFMFVADWPNRDAAFTEIVAEIEKAVRALKPQPEAAGPNDPIPAPPSFGFVPRADRDGRDIIERLREELSPQSRRLVALWGAGGVGKTTLAAEAVRAIAATTGQRVVWVTADGRPNFTFTTLLDDIAAQFDRTDLRPLAAGPKEEAVRALIAAAPTIVVLDDFETIPPEEETLCLEFLSQRAPCPALITTRQRVEGALLLPLDTMLASEASKFLDRLVVQTQDPDIYTEDVRRHILETAESNPLVVQWVVGQIDLAQAPDEVLSELSHGEGKAAQRVFDRSFNLTQMEDGGRAVLLALSLFKPSGTRPMVGEVAGMNLGKKRDKERFKKAQQTLASLRLIKQTPDGQRLTVAGLTRDFAKARLSRDPRSKTFRPRFVSRFVRYAETHTQPTAANLHALEAEKDNLLEAMDVAYGTGDWASVSDIMSVIDEFLFIRGYWDEAIRRGKQAVAAARQSDNLNTSLGHSANVARVRANRGEYKEAQLIWEQALTYYKEAGDKHRASISLSNLGALASMEGDYERARRFYEESLEINEKLSSRSHIASTLNNMGLLAYVQGDYSEARRLYEESLETNKNLGDRQDTAVSLHQLGTLALDERRLDEAGEYLEQSLSIFRGLGDKPRIAECIESIGVLRVAQGRYPEAEALFDESSKLAEALSIPRMVGCLKYSRGLLAEKRGDVAEARRLFKEALEILERLDFYKAEKARQALGRLEG